MPWFAEWFVHSSLVATQARGIAAPAPTRNHLFRLYPAAHAEGLGHKGLVVGVSPSHRQKYPLGSTSAGEAPGSGHGVGGGTWVALEEPHLHDHLFERPQASHCSGLKCRLCSLLDVWPQANGLTLADSRISHLLRGNNNTYFPLSSEDGRCQAPGT